MRILVIVSALAFAVIANDPVNSESLNQQISVDGGGNKSIGVQLAQDKSKWRDMTEEEIQKYYSNRTLTQTNSTNDRSYKIYYKADGSYDGKCCDITMNYVFGGTWKAKGNAVCTARVMGPGAGKSGCYELITDGETVKRKDGVENTKNRIWEEGNKLP